MRNPIISILVPVYKVEAYLQRCIDSVLAQDFTDWEMILVDDGSPDKCPEICDEAAKKDARIRVVHKKNGGLLSARKAGVQIARGEFFVFWDSDDTVPENALSILYNHIKQGYDVVRASGLRRTNEGKASPLEPYPFVGEINGADEYLRKQFTGEIAPYLWNGIYRATLFDDAVYNTSIENHISVGEDWVTNLIVGKRVNKALVTNDIVYHYYYNPTSYMGSSVFSLSYQKRVDSVLKEMGVLNTPSIKDNIESKQCSDIIRSFFIPELPFSWDAYKRIRFLGDKKKLSDLLELKVDRKMLLFLNIPLIYFLYSRLYCLYVFVFRLKGHKRKIII